MEDHGLMDLGFEGHPFTWNNKRGGLENIQERLDRGIANEDRKLQHFETKIPICLHSILTISLC